MQDNLTTTSNFSPSTNISLEDALFEENSIPLYAIIDSEIFGDPNLTHAEVRTYALIAGYCGSGGVCFASHQTIAEKAPWTDARNFRKYCESLEKKGYLYRRQHSRLRGGSTRYLAVRCHWKKYLKFLMKKKNYELAAEVESYFTGLEQSYLLKKYTYEAKATKKPHRESTSGSSLPPTERVTITPRNISINTNSRKYDDERGNAAAEFSELALKEMQDAGISGELLEIGKQYLLANEKLIRTKDNPIGFLIASVKKGWAADRMSAPIQEEKKKEAVQDELKTRRAWVRQLLHAYEGKEQGFSISSDEFRVEFIYLKEFLLPGDNVTYVPVSYKDPHFKNILTQQKERMDDCIRRAGKTNPVDESRTKGK